MTFKLTGRLLVLLVLLGGVTQASAEVTLQWLDQITSSPSVSPDGRVFGSGPDGVLSWKPDEGYVNLTEIPWFVIDGVSGASVDGRILIGHRRNDTNAYRWSAADDTQLLPPLPGYSPTAEVAAFDISADGSRIVGCSGCGYGEATLWIDLEPHGLGGLSGATPPKSVATAISGDGTTVVGKTYARQEAFRWTAETGMVGLGHLSEDPFRAAATDVSFDGSVVVGISGTDAGSGSQDEEAFRWTEETGMVGLGDLPGGDFRSKALAVSGDGSMLVGWSQIDIVPDGMGYRGVEGAFFWTEERGMRSIAEFLKNEHGLDVSDYYFRYATDISADGNVIVGTGWDGEDSSVWVLTIPEPSAFVLTLIGLCCLSLWRLRKRIEPRFGLISRHATSRVDWSYVTWCVATHPTSRGPFLPLKTAGRFRTLAIVAVDSHTPRSLEIRPTIQRNDAPRRP